MMPQITKRTLIKAGAGLVLGSALPPSLALSARAPVNIGWLKIQDKSHTPGQLKAFLAGLEEAGDRQGQEFVLTTRFADGESKRLVVLAQELVTERVDIILATSQPAVDASLKVTRSIPIVGRMTDDPVQSGAAQSLSRPGNNLTGVYSLLEEMTGKRLALLQQVGAASAQGWRFADA
jgi:putative ABC transport system substrate-binding protein